MQKLQQALEEKIALTVTPRARLEALLQVRFERIYSKRIGLLFQRYCRRLSVAGTWLLVRLDVNSTNNDVLLAMLVFGLGMGFSMSLYTLIVQNALPRKIGQATSALVFFRSIGGTIALAAMGSVMTSTYLPAF